MDVLVKIIEFTVFFLVIYGLYYFTSIKKLKKSKKYVPVEVGLIAMKNKIDLQKINIYQMTKVVCLTTSLILSLSLVISEIFIENIIISLFIALIIAIFLAVILYSFIGKYYKKKEKGK